MALDAKMDFDESALRRHPDISALRDAEEGDPLERAAMQKGLAYVRLGGSIGTLVNGAGLAMATMDAIKQAGAEPATSLTPGAARVRKAWPGDLKILLSNPRVRGILINIFGGILRCDVVARGIVAAARGLDVAVPLVVRLEGRRRRGTAHPARKRAALPDGLVHARGGPADCRAGGANPTGRRTHEPSSSYGKQDVVQGLTGRGEGRFHAEQIIR
ncbi:MAG: hypothetical protein V8Q84_13080 [Bilophila sp.]